MTNNRDLVVEARFVVPRLEINYPDDPEQTSVVFTQPEVVAKPVEKLSSINC